MSMGLRPNQVPDDVQPRLLEAVLHNRYTCVDHWLTLRAGEGITGCGCVPVGGIAAPGIMPEAQSNGKVVHGKVGGPLRHHRARLAQAVRNKACCRELGRGTIQTLLPLLHLTCMCKGLRAGRRRGVSGMPRTPPPPQCGRWGTRKIQTFFSAARIYAMRSCIDAVDLVDNLDGVLVPSAHII